MANQDTIYELEAVSFAYALGAHQVSALREVDLKIRAGGIDCFSGPSGSGKTTLLSLLGLIESVQGGKITYSDRDLRSLNEAERNQIRRYEIGFVFHQFHLIPVLSAEENVELFLTRQGVPEAERKQRVDQALEEVELTAHRTKRPWEMSGGQRQRVAVARAIAKRPRVIIADEPTASLDQKTGKRLMDIFRRLEQQEGVTLIIASHDPMVQEYADRHLILRDGKVVEA